MSQAGRYVVTALYWEEVTSKPGQPLDFVRHAKGSTVDLDDTTARRLLAAKAVAPEAEAVSPDDTGAMDADADGATVDLDAKIPEILAEVGDDPEKAKAALEAEQARGEAARSTLVTKLEAVIAAADSHQDS